MKKSTLLFLLPTLLLAVTVPGCDKKTTEDKANEISMHLAKSLELTDVQRRKVDIIRNDILNVRTMVFDKQMTDQIEYELASQMRREKFEPSRYDEFKKKNLKSQDEFLSYLGRKLAELHSILSPPQREKLVQDMERNREKWFGDK